MIQESIRALILIFVAEMGDKTQILAMAFATKFPVKKVLLGIAIGAFLNHGLAVLLGHFLSQVVPINAIQMVAGFTFIGFAIWTLKSEDYKEEEEEVKISFGAIVTVAIAFFLGELGDKTQLTAITLAADSKYPFMIILGTVTGMVCTGAIGIFVGKKLGEKIPEIAIKIAAALVFMIFGIQKLYVTLPASFLKPVYVIPAILILFIVVALRLKVLLRKRKEGINSAYNMNSKILHDYTKHIQNDLEIIHKEFSQEQAIDSLVDTLWVINNVKDPKRLAYAHKVRKELEIILMGKECADNLEVNEYINGFKACNSEIAGEIRNQYNMRKKVEQRVINLGTQAHNMYLVEIRHGYMLIDTGFKGQYQQFKAELAKHNIDLNQISYVFVTHAHKDHVGFLNDIIKDTNAKVILHPKAVDNLKAGENSINGGFSSLLAFVFFQFKKVLFKKSYQFDPIIDDTRNIVLTEETQKELEHELKAQILELPGHTKDSIGIIFEKQLLFCGDATENSMTGRHRIIHWIESVIDYKNSWTKMVNSEFKIAYPTHGKPFSKEQLIKNQDKLNNIKIHSLQ